MLKNNCLTYTFFISRKFNENYQDYKLFTQTKLSLLQDTFLERTMREKNLCCSVNSEFAIKSGSETSRLSYERNINISKIIEKESKIIALEHEVEVNKINGLSKLMFKN